MAFAGLFARDPVKKLTDEMVSCHTRLRNCISSHALHKRLVCMFVGFVAPSPVDD